MCGVTRRGTYVSVRDVVKRKGGVRRGEGKGERIIK